MNKRFLLGASLLVLIGGAIWFLVRRQAERAAFSPPITEADLARGYRQINGALEQPPPKAVPPLSSSQRVRLAIGGLGLPNDTQNGRLADLLTVELIGASGLELVDRQSLDKVLREVEINLSGLVRAKDAVRVGKLLRADWFLLGTAMRANDTNYVVVRIVDARTGIFRDTAVVSTDKGSEKLARELADFVRKCRADAAAARVPIYLAFGAFEDLSLNNRLVDFPAQLRAYLTAAYRSDHITMLERDHVDTLLQEMRLDLAGLTGNNGTNGGAVMQTAFWLLEGDYQSVNTAKPEVELALRISRIFGRSTNATFHGPLGEPLFQHVKESLDPAINQPQAMVMPTRVSEVRAQMARGKELARFDTSNTLAPWNPYQELTDQEARLQGRNAEEAIRAFKAVLLLDPTNGEAKIFLGACYCKPAVGRTEDGRQLFREVLDNPVQKKWHDLAAQRLLETFTWIGYAERFEWFSTAEKQTSGSHIQAFYHRQAEDARQQMLRQQGAAFQPEALAEKKLLADIRGEEGMFHGRSGTAMGDFGMDEYVNFFRPDKTKGGKKLAEFLPRLVSEFPAMAPHLTAVALSYQRETNNPMVAEFRRQLDGCRTHPEKVLALPNFWSRARFEAYGWCMEHGQYALAVDIMEGVRQTAHYTNSVTFDQEDKVALAFAYKGTEQWQEALAIFESFSNLPVVMNRGAGPWGRGFSTFQTAREAAFCKEKLGLLSIRDPREFEMGTNCLYMHNRSAFAAGQSGLWVAIGDQLVQLDFDLRTNRIEALPKDASTGINCLLVGRAKIWIGTDGDGLLEFDKASRRTVRYTDKDGLMNDVICTLCMAGRTLWIGYGVKDGLTGYGVSRMGGGGLGQLDLDQHQFRGYTPSLVGGADALKTLRGREPLDIPTRRPVSAIAVGPEGEIWFAARGSPLRSYRRAEDAWDAVPEIGCSTLVANGKRLFVGRFGDPVVPRKSNPLGVSVLNFADHTWSQLGGVSVLPSGMVSTLTLDGNDLWVGGSGYIAKIDLAQNELRKFSRISSNEPEQIQIGGGFVWVQFDRHLHRARLP